MNFSEILILTKYTCMLSFVVNQNVLLDFTNKKNPEHPKSQKILLSTKGNLACEEIHPAALDPMAKIWKAVFPINTH